MPRIYLPTVDIKKNQISITDEKAHYLTSVLRCRKGDGLIIFDGEGNCFRSIIAKSGKREVVAEVLERFSCNLESPLEIILAQGILKGEKMDLVIQKTTELGVRGIIPVVTERSQIRETRKIDRWRKIAEEASRQSGRSAAPVIHEAKAFGEFFSGCDTQAVPRGFIFYEEGGVRLSEAVSSFIPRPSSFSVIIGPEGGFTKEEVDCAKEKGFVAVSLGKRILRAETASISAVALVQFLFGDMA